VRSVVASQSEFNSLRPFDRPSRRRAGWQRDLWVSHSKIGNVQVAQWDFAGALTSYRDSLAIVEHLARFDPGNARWQHDLSVSYEHLGDIFRRTRERTEALDALRKGPRYHGEIDGSIPRQRPVETRPCPVRRADCRVGAVMGPEQVSPPQYVIMSFIT
jgi:hypothetical protein